MKRKADTKYTRNISPKNEDGENLNLKRINDLKIMRIIKSMKKKSPVQKKITNTYSKYENKNKDNEIKYLKKDKKKIQSSATRS